MTNPTPCPHCGQPMDTMEDVRAHMACAEELVTQQNFTDALQSIDVSEKRDDE